MNLRQLPYILAIESTGTLLAASKQLGISQPALSKYLSELESETGMALFYRVKKQMIPTAAGNLYLDAARDILRLSNRTYESIRALDKTEFENISIGISPHRGAKFIAGIYPVLMQFFPNCRLNPVEGYSAELIRKVQDGTVSFALTSYNGPINPDLQMYQTDSEEIVLAVPAFYPVVRHSPRLEFDRLPFTDLNEFEKYSFIMPQEDSGLYRAIADEIAELDYRPIVAFSTPNIMMEKALVEAGAGIGLIPAYHVAPNDKVAYFRLNQRMYMHGQVVFRKDHKLTEAEKFLIYLHVRNSFGGSNPNFPGYIGPELRELYTEESKLHRKMMITGNPFGQDTLAARNNDPE